MKLYQVIVDRKFPKMMDLDVMRELALIDSTAIDPYLIEISGVKIWNSSISINLDEDALVELHFVFSHDSNDIKYVLNNFERAIKTNNDQYKIKKCHRLTVEKEEIELFNKYFGVRELLLDGSFKKMQPVIFEDAKPIDLDLLSAESVEDWLLNFEDSNADGRSYEHLQCLGKIIVPFEDVKIEKRYIFERATGGKVMPFGTYEDFMIFIDKVLPIYDSLEILVNELKSNIGASKHD